MARARRIRLMAGNPVISWPPGHAPEREISASGSAGSRPGQVLTFITESGFARAQGCGLQVYGRQPVNLRTKRLVI